MTSTSDRIEPAMPARRRRAWLLGEPRPLQVALDLIGVGFGIATYLQIGEPDILLHCLWIVLVLEAFAFGFRATAIRLGISFAVVVIYAVISRLDGPLGVSLVDLDLAEWPLMMIIAILVAVMAERVMLAGERSNRRLLLGQQDERRRIALDLHDGVGQTLAALSYTLDALAATLASERSAARVEGLEMALRARGIANLALDETREVASRLRPLRLAETGLAAAIEDLVAAASVPVDVAIAPELRRPGLLPQETEATVIRIVQEALGNSIRHSRATRRWVRMVGTEDGRLVVTVGDDGVGFDVGRTRREGIGLNGMVERAAAIDGRLDVTSQPGRGSSVQLELRIPPERRKGSGRSAPAAVAS